MAGIGAELIAAKEALDKTLDRTAWQRWLKGHVHDSADTAQNYMRVARFVGKNRSASVFLGLDTAADAQRIMGLLADQLADSRV